MKTTIVWVLLLLIGVTSSVLWKNQRNKAAHANYLQIPTTSPPIGKIILPEQRRKFALEFGRKFKDKGMDATVTTTGDFHTTILIRGKFVNEALVHEMADNNDMMQDFRNMGFKILIVTDGNVTWDVDLNN